MASPRSWPATYWVMAPMWLPRCLRPVGWMPEKIRTARQRSALRRGRGRWVSSESEWTRFRDAGLALLDQHLTGNVAIRSDGGIDAVFDNLPTFPITRFAVSLDGPPRGILTAPTKCGDYEFRADFTSQ